MKITVTRYDVVDKENFFKSANELMQNCGGSITVLAGNVIEYTIPPDMLPEFNKILCKYNKSKKTKKR